MANLGTLTAQITVDSRGLDRGIGKAKKGIGGLRGAIGGLGKAMGGLQGQIAALGISLGGLLIFRDIVQTGAQFEQAMASVAGVTRATREEMEMLSETARKMGETTKFTATQAADALVFLGMTGFSAAQAMQALPGVLNLAAAADTELARTADIASNSLKTFQLPVEELSRVNDVFIGTMTRANVNMEQLAESMRYAGPLANALGYTIEETAGISGKLGDAGIQGSMAGTQLAMAMQRATKIATNSASRAPT